MVKENKIVYLQFRLDETLAKKTEKESSNSKKANLENKWPEIDFWRFGKVPEIKIDHPTTTDFFEESGINGKLQSPILDKNASLIC